MLGMQIMKESEKFESDDWLELQLLPKSKGPLYVQK